MVPSGRSQLFNHFNPQIPNIIQLPYPQNLRFPTFALASLHLSRGYGDHGRGAAGAAVSCFLSFQPLASFLGSAEVNSTVKQ
jgi:hypothetical protein